MMHLNWMKMKDSLNIKFRLTNIFKENIMFIFTMLII